MLKITLILLIICLGIFGLTLIVTVEGAYAPDEVDIKVSTDKPSYKQGDLLTIKGNGIHSYTVFIEITSSAGEIITKLMIIASNKGDFSTPWILPTTLDDGEYTVHVRDIIKTAQTKFYVGNPPNNFSDPDPVLKSKIPDWVRNIFIWYGQGQIYEDDVLNAIIFLVANQIIQIDLANQSMGTMSQGMMSQEMMMQNMPFNVDASVIMPMIDGYYKGNKVNFVHTEVSDSGMAKMMTSMINFPTLHVPELKNIPEDQTAKVYIFTNGIPGSEPYGGGPFMFQIDVFDSIPGQGEYSQFRVPYLVTWNENAKPRVLTSESNILKAEASGELTIQKSDNIVNAPMITWEIQGGYGTTMAKTSIIPRIFESMQVEGELTFFDVKNHIAVFKLHSEK